MRRVLVVLVLALGANAFAQDQPIDPGKRASIEELLSLMKLDQMQKQMFSQFQKMAEDSIKKTIPPEMRLSPDGAGVAADIRAFESQMFGLMTDRMDFAKMKPEYVRLYDETFTADEVAGILAFYKSPAGQAYVAKLPVLTSKSLELAQRVMTDVMPDLQRMNAVWVEQMRKKYSDPGAK